MEHHKYELIMSIGDICEWFLQSVEECGVEYAEALRLTMKLDWHTHASRLGVNLSSLDLNYLMPFNEDPNLISNENSDNNCVSLSDEFNFKFSLGNSSSNFPLEQSQSHEDMKFDIPLGISDASNVGLQDSQNLVHDSKAGVILSGGGFVTKNSENQISKNSKNFTNNLLKNILSIQVILNYQHHDQRSFLKFIIPLVLLLVAISSHELHFSHYFLLQRYKRSCGS
jgi:hypothetical protein